jgi:hypothetical protein
LILWVWDLASGKEQRQLATGAAGMMAVLTPDGTRVLVGGPDPWLRLLDMKSGKELQAIARGWEGRCMAFSASGRHVLIGGGPRLPENGQPPERYYGRVELWDVQNEKLLREFEEHEQVVSCIAISPDGRRGLSASNFDGDIRLWDLEGGKALRRFRSHTKRVLCAGFSPDGKHAYTGHTDNTVQIWAVPK